MTTSNHLSLVQQEFLQYLHTGSGGMPEFVMAGGSISVDKRLGIYHNSYSARLVEVLQDVFERVHLYLGDEIFDKSMRQFLSAHPPSRTTLNHFGKELPQWFKQRLPEHLEVADLATIDLLMRLAFDGANASPLGMADFAALSAQDWACVGFKFHPTVCMAALHTNASAIWNALDQQVELPDVVPVTFPSYVLVWRKELKPHFMMIDQAQFDTINNLIEGQSFAHICARCDEQASDAEPSASAQMAQHLRDWIHEELIVEITRTTQS